ncbi:hypothetical protein CARUB_v10025714mg [Capsella rubella]|uniref:Uncharacterized protein n=1 Tax=Capsella rubella TaxID=81985 RepID=R0HZC5_9BRAS|nr:hypothetical protein CARUB_v10025714mg [Capsella rubella]
MNSDVIKSGLKSLLQLSQGLGCFKNADELIKAMRKEETLEDHEADLLRSSLPEPENNSSSSSQSGDETVDEGAMSDNPDEIVEKVSQMLDQISDQLASSLSSTVLPGSSGLESETRIARYPPTQASESLESLPESETKIATSLPTQASEQIENLQESSPQATNHLEPTPGLTNSASSLETETVDKDLAELTPALPNTASSLETQIENVEIPTHTLVPTASESNENGPDSLFHQNQILESLHKMMESQGEELKQLTCALKRQDEKLKVTVWDINVKSEKTIQKTVSSLKSDLKQLSEQHYNALLSQLARTQPSESLENMSELEAQIATNRPTQALKSAGRNLKQQHMNQQVGSSGEPSTRQTGKQTKNRFPSSPNLPESTTTGRNEEAKSSIESLHQMMVSQREELKQFMKNQDEKLEAILWDISEKAENTIQKTGSSLKEDLKQWSQNINYALQSELASTRKSMSSLLKTEIARSRQNHSAAGPTSDGSVRLSQDSALRILRNLATDIIGINNNPQGVLAFIADLIAGINRLDSLFLVRARPDLLLVDQMLVGLLQTPGTPPGTIHFLRHSIHLLLHTDQ